MNARQRRRIDRVADKKPGFKKWLSARPNLLSRVSENGALIRYTKQMIRGE